MKISSFKSIDKKYIPGSNELMSLIYDCSKGTIPIGKGYVRISFLKITIEVNPTSVCHVSWLCLILVSCFFQTCLMSLVFLIYLFHANQACNAISYFSN